MADRDEKQTVRPPAREVDSEALRRLARRAGGYAAQIESILAERFQIERQCLTRAAKLLREEERDLDVLASGIEVRP